MKPFDTHDHAACMASTVSAVAQACAAEGLRLTPVRKRVLEILLEEHRAMGAYDILERIKADGLGSQPPVAYRALDFLVSHGFAHKIERLNAFVACAEPTREHSPAFLICRKCDTVAETPTQTGEGRLGAIADTAGFQIESAVLEAEGLCPGCRDGAT